MSTYETRLARPVVALPYCNDPRWLRPSLVLVVLRICGPFGIGCGAHYFN